LWLLRYGWQSVVEASSVGTIEGLGLMMTGRFLHVTVAQK
jgi:hypothetical protein